MSKETHSQDSNSDNLRKVWEEMDEIDPLTPNITQECLDAYRRAAEYDDYMFGNLDYLESWIGISTEKSIDKEVE
jgi:hypothetical protein